MYRTTLIVIDEKHPLFNYCANITAKANNLYNASLFRIRQVMTGIKKDPSDRQPNEIEVLSEIEKYLPSMQTPKVKFKMPTPKKWMLSYTFLDALFKRSKNPDYYADGLPAHASQKAIKAAIHDMKSFFALNKMYKAGDPSVKEKPSLPHYKKSGGHCTAASSNVESYIAQNEDGKMYLHLPLTKEICLLPDDICADLEEVKIKPFYGKYRISIITKNGKEEPEATTEPNRVISIDLGVSNFAAITNNIGEPCLLFKGGVIKCTNQWYNKKLAKIKSKQTKGTTNKFKATPESNALCEWRDNRMRDLMHKYAKAIVEWCVDHTIDTIIIGQNTGWKNNSNMGKEKNQEFVSIPYSDFKFYVSYRAKAVGINVVCTEESYTSKASFIDKDYIPTYGKDDDKAVFSGTRGPTTYNGHHRPSNKPFRGIYKTKAGIFLNSDLNGSANIMQKILPNAFVNGIEPDFDNVIIIKHPDFERSMALREKQFLTPKKISNAKQKRFNRKVLARM